MSDAPLGALLEPLAPLMAAPPRAWVVGGGLRDALLGRSVADVDLAVDGDAGEASERLARAHRARRFPLSREFGAWRVQGGRLGMQVDLTPLQGADLAEDLGRRDLTVNALALAVTPGEPELIDPHGGLRDLRDRRLRLVSDGALAADPVRILRIARLAEQLRFTVDPAAAAAARAQAARLWESPGERLMGELGRIVTLARADRAIETLDDIGGLGALVPQLEDCRGVEQSPYHHRDVLGHTLEVVEHTVALCADPEPVFRSSAPRVAQTLAAPLADGLTAREGLVLAAVLHDMAKAATKAVLPDGRISFMGHDAEGAAMADDLMRRLRTSTRLRDMVVLCVRQHLPLGFMVHRTPLSLRQIDRYLRRTAPAEAEIIVLTVADRLATRGPRTTDSAITRHLVLAREVMAQHYRIADREPIRPPLPGDVLARELGRTPGPWLADLLTQLREEQLVGAVVTPAQALAFSRRWLLSRP